MMDSLMKRLRRELLMKTSICLFHARAFERDGLNFKIKAKRKNLDPLVSCL